MTASDRRIAWLVSSSGFSPEERLRRQAEIQALAPQGCTVEVITPAGSPAFLSAFDDFAPAARSLGDHVAAIDPDRYPVAVLAGAVDPGLDEVRARAAVPVVGPFQATLEVAALLGRGVTVISSDPLIGAATEQKLADEYPNSPVVSVRNIGVSVESISGMMNDPAALAEVRRLVVDEGRAAIEEDGAQALQLGTMTFATLGVTDDLAALGVPVLDPARIALGAASLLMASLAPSAVAASRS